MTPIELNGDIALALGAASDLAAMDFIRRNPAAARAISRVCRYALDCSKPSPAPGAALPGAAAVPHQPDDVSPASSGFIFRIEIDRPYAEDKQVIREAIWQYLEALESVDYIPTRYLCVDNKQVGFVYFVR